MVFFWSEHEQQASIVSTESQCRLLLFGKSPAFHSSGFSSSNLKWKSIWLKGHRPHVTADTDLSWCSSVVGVTHCSLTWGQSNCARSGEPPHQNPLTEWQCCSTPWAIRRTVPVFVWHRVPCKSSTFVLTDQIVLFLQALSLLNVCKLNCSCHMVLTQEWLPFTLSAIKVWLMGCSKDGCNSGWSPGSAMDIWGSVRVAHAWTVLTSVILLNQIITFVIHPVGPNVLPFSSSRGHLTLWSTRRHPKYFYVVFQM